MKKSTMIAGAATALAATLALGACASSAPDSSPDPSGGNGGGEPTQTYQIAITQYLAHPSLDLITQGFKEALTQKGLVEGTNVTYTFDNALGEAANTATIAGKYAADPAYQLILAVATPSAQAVATAIQDRPVLFSGVTEPVVSGIVPSWDANPASNVTGTSDLNPEGRPAELIKDALGDKVKTVGFPYSLAEANSKVQLELLRTEAQKFGIEVKDSGITSPSELTQGLQALEGVDAIFVGTDNTVVTGIDQVVSFCNDAKIPLFVADASSVGKGAVAGRGVDYYQMGLRTGEMAYDILVNGKTPGEIAPLQVLETEIIANPDAAEAQGLTLPESFMQNAKVVTE
jgi:putative ABC transport system substrate-binding protein